MSEQFSRLERILGEKTIEMLFQKHIAIFGLGGVGGYVAEALVRSGIGKFDLIDNDKIALSNLNRQIIADYKTIGRYKTDVMKERMQDINPRAEITLHTCFFLPENADGFDFRAYDYVVDAVDTVTAKIEIILRAQAAGVPVISCMGTGNKMDPSMLEVADIYQTSACPLAKVMRHELRKRGIEKLKVIYSREEPMKASDGERVPGSTAFVPPAAGLLIASEVVRDLVQEGKKA